MTHPSEAELRLLLDDRLPSDRAEPVAAHLDGCRRCQDSADRLTEIPRDLWAALVVAADRPASSLVSAEGPAIPGYEDFQPLGQGGGGVVYLATESASGRRVAVKLLRGGATADPRQRARFLDEARAAANLRHPNIVTALVVGERRGQPYYVMEYLPAGSLADRLDGAPLGSAEAAALMLEITRAVQHAHEAGVIHRDLKPGNILLDAPTRPGSPWTPKVADFGMAKLNEATARGATPTQAILGTPGYMAPEQAFGGSRDVGPAADVHALGAILYELLTGRPPFRGETVYETLLMVRDQEPAPPSRLRPGLPRNLETICLKCLEKRPARRYASAAALGDDLRAHLAGRPVAARPVGRLGRLERWARREPAVAGLAGGVILLVAVLFAVVTTAWRRAEVQRGRLAEAVGQAEARGEKLFQSLIFSAEATSKLFLHPSLVSQVERGPLLRGLEVLEQASDLPDSPEDELRLAYARLQMASGLHNLGELDHSRLAVRQAQATLERLTREDPEHPLFAYRLAQARMQLSGLERAAGRSDEEARLHLEAFRGLQRLVERHPEKDGFASDLAVYRARVAQDFIERGRDDEAEPLLERSLAGLRELIARYPHDPVRYEHFRRAGDLLGGLRLRRGDGEGYEALMVERLEMCDRVRDRRDWPLIFQNLLQEQAAVALQRLGRGPTAEKFVSRALAAGRETVSREPASTRSRARLADWLIADGHRTWPADPSAAADAFGQAIAILEPLIDGPERAAALSSLAWLRAHCPTPSIRDPAKAVDHARALQAESDPGTILLGIGLCESGRHDAARAELERCLAELSSERRDPRETLVRLYLALAHRKLGAADRAAEQIRAAEECPAVEGAIDGPTDAALRRVEAVLADRS